MFCFAMLLDLFLFNCSSNSVQTESFWQWLPNMSPTYTNLTKISSKSNKDTLAIIEIFINALSNELNQWEFQFKMHSFLLPLCFMFPILYLITDIVIYMSFNFLLLLDAVLPGPDKENYSVSSEVPKVKVSFFSFSIQWLLQIVFCLVIYEAW